MQLRFEPPSAARAAGLPGIVQVDESDSDDTILTLQNPTLLHSRPDDHTFVYRATMVQAGPASQSVVCKLYWLLQEWNNYQRLENLQGTYIPKAIRLIQGMADNDPVVCAIYQDCGDPPNSFADLSREAKCVMDSRSFLLTYNCIRTRVYKAARAIHKAGYRHHLMEEGKFVINGDGEVRIIDLEQVTEHQCRLQSEPTLWAPAPVMMTLNVPSCTSFVNSSMSSFLVCRINFFFSCLI